MQHDDDRAILGQAPRPRHVSVVLAGMPHDLCVGSPGLYSPNPYPSRNVDILVSEAWETISLAENARHQRARESESDAIAAPGPSED